MKMTIGKKLSFGFLGLAALVLLSGVVGIIILFKVTEKILQESAHDQKNLHDHHCGCYASCFYIQRIHRTPYA